MENICVECRKSADCKRKPRTDQWTVAGCSWFEADTVITNAERIRSMTDEELAKWLERIRLCCDNDLCGRSCPFAEVCYSNAETPKEMIDWLKATAEEG